MAKTGIIQWDATAANNTDVDGVAISENCPVANLNNMGRAIMARVVERLGSSVSVASASTVNLGDNEEEYVTITGTTTITSFGTPTVANKFGYWVVFSGALTLTHNGTSLILPGAANVTTRAGEVAKFRHEGSGNWRCISYPPRWAYGDGTAGQQLTSNGAGSLPTFQGAALPTGFLYGLTLSNNGIDANNDIDIATGKARDDTDAADMVLASALTKRLDATWAVGTNQGMLDTGTKSGSATQYHIFEIKRSDTGVVDILASLSYSSPTMPANYNYKRCIGTIFTDGSGNNLPFVQNGDFFQLKVAKADVNTSTLGTSATAFTMTVPAGRKCLGLFHYDMAGQSSRTVYFQSPSITDASASTSAVPYGHTPKDSATQGPNGQILIETNTSSQIKMSASAASTSIVVMTDGWWDSRGRDG